MKFQKPNKKEMIYIGIVAAVILLYWLFRKAKSRMTTVLNGAGRPADTNYLTYNIPPINGDGLSQPVFGNNYYPGITVGNGGGCNSCSQPLYYGSNQDLANAVGDTGVAAVQAALSNLPNYMVVNVDQSYNSGQIQAATDYGVINHIPVLALG